MANWDLSTTIITNITLHLLDPVTSITHSKVMGEDASTLSQFTYGYDANGQLISETGSRVVGDCSWVDCKVVVGTGDGFRLQLGVVAVIIRQNRNGLCFFLVRHCLLIELG
jgi:hypothetical protein